MAIYELSKDNIIKIEETSFVNEKISERFDLQRLLIEKINIISDDLMVITEEFGQWIDSNRRIDILAINKEANLVVIELKRTQDGGHMELQSLRYASMISALTFDKVVDVYEKYLNKRGSELNAKQEILNFLEWEEELEQDFGNDVKIILVSEDFSKEITTSVIWLNLKDLDITCIKMKPYKIDQRILIDIQQIIPLPEAEEYQIKLREKDRIQKSSKWKQKRLPEILEDLKNNCTQEEYNLAMNIKEWLEIQTTMVFPTANGFASYINFNKRDQYFF